MEQHHNAAPERTERHGLTLRETLQDRPLLLIRLTVAALGILTLALAWNDVLSDLENREVAARERLRTQARIRARAAGETIQATLEQRDPGPLIAGLSALNPVSAARLRGDFPSYGCCTVTDPITELITLDVLEGPRS